MSMFMTEGEGGAYVLTVTGIAVLAAVAVLMWILGFLSLIGEKRFAKRQPVILALLILLSLLLSILPHAYIPVLNLPEGGYISLFSMLFLVMTGYFYGFKTGLCCSLSGGILIMAFQAGGFYSVLSAVSGYILSYGALGLAGIFHKNKRQGLFIGYTSGAIFRYVFAVISLSMNRPLSGALLLGAQTILTEALATMILIKLPPVASAFMGLKLRALPDGENTPVKKKKTPEKVYEE